MKRSIIILVTAFFIAGCATHNYRRNLANAYITPWTHISHADGEEIIGLVSNETAEPIIGISAYRRVPSEIEVITGKTSQEEYETWHGYTLKKIDGRWKISFHGEISHSVAIIILRGDS